MYSFDSIMVKVVVFIVIILTINNYLNRKLGADLDIEMAKQGLEQCIISDKRVWRKKCQN